ncbi:MAG: prepilin-type N-terminal cleavage/methylation domain-containing protein [Candidatus Peribacteria bacterium]|nr:prepilin-type N-terminal cleavage/methylation domain-containing protein [Candidatus Peribacteria bacterium]
MPKAQRGFTLIEVIIALTLFAFVIIGIITAVNRAYAYVQQARLNVIAMNLTREGMEMMYNIRDTNWKRFSGKKDECRWSFTNGSTCSDFIDHNNVGNYQLTGRTSTGQFAFKLDRINIVPSDTYDKFWDYKKNSSYSTDLEIFRVPFS